MKVSCITRHAISNYGSLLQAYATQRAVESLGHEFEIMDYVPACEDVSQQVRTLLSTKPSWNGNPLKKSVYRLLMEPETKVAGKRFARERSQLLKMSPHYASLEELKANPPKADVYMTGSDQVWGPISSGAYDLSYALEFAPEGARRISYAASFGKKNIPDSVRPRFLEDLRAYEAVFVREDAAREQLASWGIEAGQVVDPTLLLDGEAWRRMAAPAPKGEYILVYQIHSDPTVGQYAVKVAKKLGLPLIRISASLHQASREGKFKWLPTLAEFLSYVDNAACLVTDSFHGTAFAINLNTPLVEVLPKNGTSSRNVSILRLTDLTDRVLQNLDDVELASKQIDFGRVNDVMGAEREKSLAQLKSMIEE